MSVVGYLNVLSQHMFMSNTVKGMTVKSYFQQTGTSSHTPNIQLNFVNHYFHNWSLLHPCSTNFEYPSQLVFRYQTVLFRFLKDFDYRKNTHTHTHTHTCAHISKTEARNFSCCEQYQWTHSGRSGANQRQLQIPLDADSKQWKWLYLTSAETVVISETKQHNVCHVCWWKKQNIFLEQPSIYFSIIYLVT